MPRKPSPSADLPPEQPLAMPVQDLWHAASIARGREPLGLTLRRLALLAASGLIGFVASTGVAAPLSYDGFDVVDFLMSLVAMLLFAWIAFGFLNALAGLFVLARRGPFQAEAADLPTTRTAILVPIHNEEVGPLADRIGRMLASLRAVGAASLFDVFVLSDSAPAAERFERDACRRLRTQSAAPVYYRRRALNTERKPGNIADWVRRFGAGYEAMLVLDADSLMSGAAMARLAAELEADPALGLIQTNPRLAGARTFFARWQAFATALYGPVASAGLEWWSGGEATFWGHNAIIRTRAFAASCGLPALAGPEPFGGHIMSHDMVEAALLRRRGWKCRLLLLPAGSYEESPPTLVDHGIRDRRWCQGNLQHLQLLDAHGLHWVSRLQLLMGASAYLTSPLWLLLLLVGQFQAVRNGTPLPVLFGAGALLATTIALLFGTKLMALVWAARDRPLRASLGGWSGILRGLAADVPLSILTAPVIMASQCRAIVEILSGRRSGWAPQRRDTDGITLTEAIDHYCWHVVLGIGFLAAALSDVGGALWSLPVALGLIGAPVIAMLGSRKDWGTAAARLGIFGTLPEAEAIGAASETAGSALLGMPLGLRIGMVERGTGVGLRRA